MEKLRKRSLGVKRSGRKSKATKRGGTSKSQPDYILVILFGVLIVFGLIMVFEASIFNADTYFDDRFYFVKQQAVWVVLGLVVAAVFYLWDYRQFTKSHFIIPAVGVTIALLVAVLVVGEEINGSKRWFYIGPVPIQPAELAKLVFLIYLCAWLSKGRKKFKKRKEMLKFYLANELGAFLFLLGIVGGLIIAEPDLGTAVVICVVAFAVYFSSGQDLVHTVGSALIVLVGGILGLIAAILESYRVNRIKTFLELVQTGEVVDPRGTGYQIQQVLIGIGSGGLWGKGFGESRQRWGFLVENTAFTDSIFAIILEELGMAGGVVLILIYLFILFRAYRIAAKAPDRLGQLLAGGIGFWLVFQAFMHMGANVAIIPLTGVPLPFITYGGSSTIVAFAAMGMLLNVSRYVKD